MVFSFIGSLFTDIRIYNFPNSGGVGGAVFERDQSTDPFA
jgi:hypothetical protein